MKRILCFIVSIALCLNLCPVWAADEGDEAGTTLTGDETSTTLTGHLNSDKPLIVVDYRVYNTGEYTLTGTGSSAIRIENEGKLYLTGNVLATNGSGVQVQPGGFLSITDSGTSVRSTGGYALYIADGATVRLSGGTYSGVYGTIYAENGDYAALLEPGYAFYDVGSEELVTPEKASWSGKFSVVACEEHVGKTYAHISGTTTHTWSCPYCPAKETEACTFGFDENGNGTCGACGNGITVAVVRDSLKELARHPEDETIRPANGSVTVTVKDASEPLTQGADYTVDYTTRANVGSSDVTVTVAVTGIAYGGTFTDSYTFTKEELEQPALQWAAASAAVTYSGKPVEKSNLPGVTINISSEGTDLKQYLQYSYRKQGETAYTNGLPTDAGTYDVVVSLPEMDGVYAVSSEPITLTINKLNPISKAPATKNLTYNWDAQELVSAGVLEPAAEADGAVILYATSKDGSYSTEIPTGTTVSTSGYHVWYKVEATDNCNGVGPLEVSNVKITHRQITPRVDLSQYTYLYDGGEKQPTVTVTDTELGKVIPDTEYAVEYVNNRNVGTATVKVTNKGNGNYIVNPVNVTFQITRKNQDTLSITNKPDTVTYGDEFTLSTVGGSGSGKVTWEVVSGSATVNSTSGRVKITGHGDITIKATKSGTDPDNANVINYENATDTWQFTADLKPVTATVTAEDKTYNGDKNATVHAVVVEGVLPGDEITITGLTGTFEDENAGANKTVTVVTTGASINGKNSEHYAVTYSSALVKATINKAVVHITTAPGAAELTYSGEKQALINASVLVVDTSGVLVEYALSEDGPYSTDIPEGTNAGAYKVWYRVQETTNYTGLAPDSVDVTIKKKPVAPTIVLDTASYIYDGNPKEPTVTLYEADGTTPIPADQYSVSYSANVNVGTAAVTVTAKADGNYEFTNAPVTKTFEITKEQAKVITKPEAAGDPLTFNNRDQKLVTAGTASGGTMVYSLDEGETKTYSEDIPTGKGAKDYTVYYKVKGDGNHSDSDVGQVTVTIAPKTVKDPTIILSDTDEQFTADGSYTYDGTAKKPTVVVIDGSTEIDADEYNVVYRDCIDAGRATVEITNKPGGNYIVTGSQTFVIVKADIKFDPAPSAADITYDGKTHELLVPGTTSGGEVLYALNSPTSTYTAAIPTGTEAGDYTVYYKVIGDKNHNDLNDLTTQKVDVTIKRKPLTQITIELSPRGFEYDGTPKMPAVTVKDGNTVLPEEEYTVTCTDASNVTTTSPTDVGEYTITIGNKTGGNYDLSKLESPANEATFTIGQIAQDALVIEGKPAATNYGDSFTLSLSGGSGDGAVTWVSTGPVSVDTVDADGKATITITGVGEATVTVKKNASTNYLAAQAQYTFTAAPKPVTADVVAADKVFDGTTGTTVTSASITAINNDKVTIDLASIKADFDTPSVGTGKTVTLDTSKVQVTGDTAKYAISYPDTVTADITQANTTISLPPARIDGLTYNGQPQALVTAGQSNVGFIVYSLDGTNFSADVPTGTDSGTYKVYYKVDETDDYTGVAVNTTPISVTIAPKTITPVIEVKESSYLYDGTKKNPTITVKDGKTVIDEEQYTATWDNDLTSAGTHKVTVSKINGKNYTFDDVTATVEIVAGTQGAITITGQPEHVYYGDTVTTLGTTGGVGNGTVKWSITAGKTNSTIDEDTGVLTVKDTGSITVTAERTVPNYAPVSNSWTFTVEPKYVTAEVTVANKVYDGNNTATVTKVEVKAGDLVNEGDTITITGLTGTFADVNVGTGKTVRLDRPDPGFSISADTAKYTVNIPATAHADITPREVTVTVTLSDHDLQTDDDGKYYYTFDGSEKKPAVKVTANDNGAVLTSTDYTVDYADNKNAGTATVTITANAGGNYTFTVNPVEFEIRNGAAVLTETPKAKDLTYDGTAQDLVNVGSATGGTVVYSSTGATNSYSETIPQGTGAGTYTVYYKVRGDGNHDDTAPGQVSVTIKPREITAIIALSGDGLQTGADGTYSYVYDGSAKKPDVTVTGGVDANPIGSGEYSVFYRDNTNAGTATVIVSDNNGGNYIVNGTATFEITRKAPAVTAPVGKTGLQYNGALQELVTAGVSHDGTVMYSVNGGNYSAAVPSASAVGNYAITYKVVGDANHSDTEPVTLPVVSIAKNTVNSPTISLSSDQFTFNGGQQKPTVDVYDDNGNLIPKNEYTAEITNTTGGDAGIVSVGTYTVTVTTPDSSNYVITNENDDNGIAKNTRTFKIVPANQETISITGTKAQVRYGDVIQLGTTGGVGGSTLTWTVTDANGNAVSSTISATGLLTVKDVGGPVKVMVKRTADNYNTVSATWEFSAAKKPVTAIVTVADKTYDGNPTATITSAKVNESDLVAEDTVTISGLTATFDNENVGQNKTVKITGGPIIDTRYDITIPATTTASITAVAATVGTDPTPKTLTYDASQAQELVAAGTVTGGIMVYSLDGTNFTPSIPKGKDAGTYTVYFKAQGDGNHTDSEVKSTPVTIGKQSVTPQIKLTPSSVQYDGKEHTTTVTLWDDDNNVIPESEYKVTYVTDGGADWTKTGTYTVKIEDIDRGNYVVASTTATFTISTTAQNPLEITNKPGLVYYGDTFTLSAVGGSGSGTVTWSVDNTDVVEIDGNGFVKIVGTGSAVIKAEKSGGANYETATATYPLNALKKPVTAIVTADDKVYDESDSATIHVTWNGLVGNDTINTSALTGTFDNPNVGQNKTVTISGSPISSDNYEFTIPGTTTASILKADTDTPELTANDRDYDRTTHPLVNGGDDKTVYSTSRDGVYSSDVPTATNAGTYTVWYKELGDANHNDSAPQSKTVTISRKSLNPVDVTLSGNDLQVVSQEDGSKIYSYVYDGTDKKPTVTIKDGDAVVPSGEYTVNYTNNKNVSTADAKGTVTVTCNEGGNYAFAEQTVPFKITSAAAQLTKSPEAKDLTYIGPGQKQELVTVGTATGGHIEYSLDGATYSKDIPKGEDAGTYTVTYKVVGDGNYASGTETWTVSVTIRQKEIVSPKVTVSGDYTYNGSPQVPAAAAVEVKDGDTVIPSGEYTVSCRDNVEAGQATVIITNANGGNYIVNGSGSFTIGKADVSDVTAPVGKKNLPYNGGAQELASAGTASGGTMLYSLSENGGYFPVIPTGTAVGEYTVWYKVQGDGNHEDTTPVKLDASIIVNEVKNPTVQLSPVSVTFNGKKQEPTVTIKDDNGQLIDGSEYTATFTMSDGNTDLIKVGVYSLTVAATGSNYDFTSAAISGSFEILPADQTPLTITGKRERVCYGDTFQLGTSGGSGTITWAVSDGAPASINNGLLTVTGVGSVTVTATSTAAGHNDQTDTWTFYAEKKPVTAVVTAQSREYKANDTTAAVTATLQSSDLVNGDEQVAITLSGSFDDPNAGTDKKVTVNSTSPVFPEGKANIYENYNITYPATATASIFKADIKAEDVTAPTAKDNLEYTGLAQTLVNPGSATGGVLEYSTDNITYSAALPTGTNADSYDVWYRVKGDSNHNDTAGTQLAAQVTIAPQKVTVPTIELKPRGASYDGAEHKPTTITVKDNNGRTIPDSEYIVDYGDGNWKDKGTYKVKITDAKENGGNYVITEIEAEFEILATGQSPLTITGKPGTVRYGDSFTLSAVGGSGTGAIGWEVTAGADVAEINANGLVKILKAGSVTITATKVADGNYGESSDSWTFSAEKKPVKAVVTAKNKEFNGNDNAELVITWKDGDLLGSDADDITLNLTGTFDTPDVGTNKTVTINGTAPSSDKYEISWNGTTTASITAGAATVTAPTVTALTYNGSAQPLVNAGSATNGTIYYSLDGIVYGPNVPTGKNAGSYTVWYKVEGSDNYSDVAPAVIPVTIEPKTVADLTIELSPESFDYDGSAKIPNVVVKDGSTVIPIGEYTLRYSNNTNAGTASVIIENAPGGNYIVNGTANFTIRAGAAVLTLAPQEKDLTYSGRAQALVTPGTAVNGHVEYSSDGVNYSMTVPKGTDADEYSVFYKVVGDNGYGGAGPWVLTVTIEPKAVTPTIKVGGKTSYSTPYTGDEQEPDVTVTVEGKVLAEGTDYYIVGYSDNTNPGTATVTVASASDGNYQFYADATFVITKVKAVFSADPIPKTDLVYTGDAQALMTFAGYSQDGTVVCSLNGGTFYPFIPKGTETGDYVVMVKVQGDEAHTDSDIKTYQVSIGKNTIAEDKLSVTLSDDSLKYTGSELKPTVTVRDVENNVIIAASEYSVIYKNNISVGQADVTVTSSTKNYSFQKTVNFMITDADAPTLKITGQPDTVYYGDTLKLGTTGGSGTVTWSVESGSESAESLGGGRFKIKGSGSITVKAATSDSSDTWTFYADPKPVRAIVTAADKVYDNSTAATLTVAVTGLVSGDIIGSGDVTASGYFTDANAGTNKTVIITGLSVSDAIKAKYDISCDSTITAAITPAALSVTEEGKPKAITGLTYTGQPQALVSAGTAANGNMAYSLDGANYSFTVPTGTDAGSYTVWYKAVANDENHKDSAPAQVTGAAIGVNNGKPTVTCSPSELPFDGAVKTPTITVLDSAGREIPSGEYIVSGDTSATAVGEYTVTVKDKTGSGNYEFSETVTGTYKIVSADQNPLSIVTDIPTNIHYGDTFKLSAIGGSGSGAIQWKSTNESVATVSQSGVVKVIGTGEFTIEACRAASGGYSQSNTDTLPFHADPKPITAVATAVSRGYNGGKDTTVTVTVPELNTTISATGTFDDENVGTGKTVTIVYGEGSQVTNANYQITWPSTTTASIYKVDAQIKNAPQPNDLTYVVEADGSPKAQALVTGGSTVGGIGTVVYSTSEKGAYSTAIPTGTNAGTYSVWYKVADSINYTGIPAAEITVEIKKADPGVTSNPTASGSVGQTLSEIELGGGSFGVSSGKFAWEDDSQTVEAGKFYNVIFTPGDTVNYKTVTVQVQVTDAAQTSLNGGGSTPAQTQAQTQTTVRDGTASTVLSASDGNKLVQQAAASQSQNVVIKPEISGNVTKSEVSIPSATVSKLSSDTDANLTVASPVGDVTIPNRALDTLGQTGGNVSVVTEQVGQGVALTLTSGGETVTQVPGGVTLSVPVEDASPGTVAVIVNEDGTRETVKNSVVNGDVMNIPLSGSATVEIVDNSKDFDDVPPESWEADAVDFASSHELLSGTGETTFSPDTAMSRGMLATVLYRLEGNPDMELTDAFSDVADGAWYADGVAWAAANGIAGGYGDDQFGPNDNITREQFVVMLWRYAGSPEAGSGDLDFTDADQASGFAREALCWAVENGILNGVGGGALDPKGMATRAQAAQLLKNFLEKA